METTQKCQGNILNAIKCTAGIHAGRGSDANADAGDDDDRIACFLPLANDSTAMV